MRQTVFVVDDDTPLRDALLQLLETAGHDVEGYADGLAFLAAYQEDRPGCLLLDVAMPGMTGLEVQAALRSRGLQIPIVFLTGHGDIPMTVQAVQAGAVDFLEKPIQGVALLERIQRALALDHEHRHSRAARRAVVDRYRHLTEREREVMALVVMGASSKDIARQLGISFRTVEAHRAHVMHKMGAANLAELLRLAAYCGLEPAQQPSPDT